MGRKVLGEVLFRSPPGCDDIVVAGCLRPDGGLRVVQRCRGPWAAWCFGMWVCRIVMDMSPTAVGVLGRWAGVDGPQQLLGALRLRFTGYECLTDIQELLDRLGAPYEMRVCDAATAGAGAAIPPGGTVSKRHGACVGAIRAEGSIRGCLYRTSPQVDGLMQNAGNFF